MEHLFLGRSSLAQRTCPGDRRGDHHDAVFIRSPGVEAGGWWPLGEYWQGIGVWDSDHRRILGCRAEVAGRYHPEHASIFCRRSEGAVGGDGLHLHCFAGF